MTVFNRLQNLVDLAKEPSSEKRRDLLREVTDVFLEQPDQYNPMEREYFGEIMGKVAQSVEREIRKDLAMRLSDVAAAPEAVIKQLADDEIEVAKSILENSLALSDGDLIDIIKKKGAEHQSAVARRVHVSEEVSDTLVDHGANEALVTLVANQGAQISRDTMKKVVVRAETDEELHAPVLDRADLPPDLMHDMFWFVSSALREQILTTTSDIDVDILDGILAETERKVGTLVTGAMPEKTDAQIYIDKMSGQRQLNESLLVQLLREKRIPELICGFSRLAKIGEDTARRIIFDKSGEGLAVACKANRFDRSTFSTFVLLGSPEGSRSIEETYELLDLYDRVPIDVAQRTIRFWRVRRDAMEQAA